MNVLVSENDKLIRDAAVVGLENFDFFDVDVAIGMSAMELIRQKDFAFAMIGIDPGDSAGHDLLHDIHERNIALDIIIMASEIIAQNMRRDKIKSNIFAFVEKPIDPLHFYQTVNRLKTRLLDRK